MLSILSSTGILSSYSFESDSQYVHPCKQYHDDLNYEADKIEVPDYSTWLLPGWDLYLTYPLFPFCPTNEKLPAANHRSLASLTR